MFSIDELIQRCTDALRDDAPALAVRRVVAESVRDPEAVLHALGPADRVGLTTYASGPHLTVQRIVWGPGITSTVHEHTVWAVVGVFAGAELNVRYDIAGDRVVERERTSVGTGDALLLSPHEAHAVTGSPEGLTQALHVYGGDITALPRREWVGDVPRAFDGGATLRAVQAYNAWITTSGRTPTAEEGAQVLVEAGYLPPAGRGGT